jgi:hypothetical protein
MLVSNSRKFAHPKVVKMLPVIENIQTLKESAAISDEEKPVVNQRLPRQKPDLKIRKESFESQESTNESHLSEELAALSPKSKMVRDLVSDYGKSIETYLKQQEK